VLLVIAFALRLARSITGPLNRARNGRRDRSAPATSPLTSSSVRGPSETAQVAAAFNDLVANLRLLEGKSRALASGELDDPVMAIPLPGRLGDSIAQFGECSFGLH
jgi:methyl-accepting chemotaxis protein